MTYSSGVFTHPNTSLSEASLAKYDRLLRKLGVGAGMTVTEIGTGWGGMALRAAQEFDARVTSTTISREQYAEANRRMKSAEAHESIRPGQVRLLQPTGVIWQIAAGGQSRPIGERRDDRSGGLARLPPVLPGDRSQHRHRRNGRHPGDLCAGSSIRAHQEHRGLHRPFRVPRRFPAVDRQDHPRHQPAHETATPRRRGPRGPLRRHAAPTGGLVSTNDSTTFVPSVSTTVSYVCGVSISPTAKRPSPNAIARSIS